MKRARVFAVCLLLVLLVFAFAVPAQAQEVNRSTDVSLGGTGCKVSYTGGSVYANIWTGQVSVVLGRLDVDLSSCFHQ